MFNITIILLLIAILAMVFLLIRGTTVFDRLLALNIICSLSVTLITLYAIYIHNYYLLDISLAYSIMGYLGVTLFSLFILKGGREK